MPPLPPLIKALMLICTAVFCVQLLLPMVPMDGLFALWPWDSGFFWPWQLLSYSFLHANLGHLLFNMLGLWMFGCELERLWGQKRFWQLLAASVLTAGLAQLAVSSLPGPHGPTIGASGAIFGLLLAYALVFPRRQFDLMGFLPMLMMMVPNQVINMLGMVLFVLMFTHRAALPFLRPIPIPALTMVAIYGGLELLLGVFGSQAGVAHFAHLGGMLGAWLMIQWWRGRLIGGSRRR